MRPQTGRFAPLWGWPAVMVLLLFALALSPAAPHTDLVDFDLEINPRQALLSQKPLCVGETLTLYATVSRSITRRVGSREVETTAALIGMRVDGSVADSRVGTLTRQGNGVTGGTAGNYQQVAFTFKAKAKGVTNLHFSTTFEDYWIAGSNILELTEADSVTRQADLLIAVKPCKAKARTVQRWSGTGYTLIGTMDEAELTAGEDGRLTGRGTLTWVASTVVPDCVSTDDFAPSPVDLSGAFDDSGQLALTLTFTPAEDSASIRCEAFGRGVYEDRSWVVLASPDPLNVSVSEAGGVVTQPQRIVGQQSTANGLALISVEVENDESAAAALNRLTLGLPAILAPLVAR